MNVFEEGKNVTKKCDLRKSLIVENYIKMQI